MYYSHYGYLGLDNEYENLKMMKVSGKNQVRPWNPFDSLELFEFNTVKVCMLKKLLDFSQIKYSFL